jgi:fluoride ion exporter CrcB/FEX
LANADRSLNAVAVGGFWGGLTTLSARSNDAAVHWRLGDVGPAAVDLAVLGLVGCFLWVRGFLLARRWERARYCTA